MLTITDHPLVEQGHSSRPTAKRAMGSHQSHRMGTDVWLTPPHIIDALGPFDLDPCAATDRPWDTATHHYTKEDDGLAQQWEGRVWCNPPYGQQAWTWLERLADHGHGTALVFARTETAGFFRTVWRRASACLFIEGRLHFHHPDGTRAPANAGAPSVLVAYGDHDAHRLAVCGIPGAYVDLRPGVAA